MKLVVFARQLLQAVIRHNVGMLAAAVAFFGFSAMLPLFLLVLFGATYFMPPTQIQGLAAAVVGLAAPSAPSEVNLVGETVDRLLSLRGKMSLVALFGLLWTAIGGFVSFQQILDVIWELRSRRSFVRQYIVGFAMVGLSLLLAVASAVAPTVLRAFGDGLRLPAAAADRLGLLGAASGVLFPVWVFVVVYFSFRFLPSHALKDRYLAVGAAAAALGVVLSRAAFTWYLGHLGQYELVYGALAFVLLLLFWIYIVSTIILLCGELAVCWSRAAEGSGGCAGGPALGSAAPWMRRGRGDGRVR